MANAAILKEYLVALGVQDNMTPKLQRTLRQSQRGVRDFASGVKMAGAAMSGLLLAANTGIARFITGLVDTDDRVRQLAEDLEITTEEANKLHFALRTMGRSLEEIEASPELSRQFEQLRSDAARIGIPDMSEGLYQVRQIQGEFMRLRNTASHGMQWIGHHLLKYLHQPMERLRDVFSGLNDRIIDGMPEWSRRIANVMASVVRITTSVIRGAVAIFNAIRRIFDMIPTEIRLLMGILAAFAAFIRAGPIGKMMMIFTLLMLLVDDFFTYLDGGEALFGGLWRMLINLWDTLNQGGGFIDRLKQAFVLAMDVAVFAIRWVIDWVARLWRRILDFGALNNFRAAFERVGAAISEIFRAVTAIFRTLFGRFTEGAETLQPFLAWLIGVALPITIGFIADMIGGMAGLVGWFFELEHTLPILLGLIAAFTTLGIAMKVQATGSLKAFLAQKALLIGQIGIVKALKLAWTTITAALNAVKMLNPKIAIIATIIAATALIIRHWDAIADFFRNLWDRITGIFSAAANDIVSFFRGIIDWIKDNFKSILLFIINPFAGVFHFLYENFGWFREFVHAVINAVITFFRNAVDTIRNIWSAITSFFAGTWRSIANIFSVVGNWFKDRFSEAVQRIIAVFTAIIEFFTDIWDSIVAIFSVVADWFRNKFNMAVENIVAVFTAIIEFFASIWDSIVAIFSVVGDFFTNIFQGAVDGIVSVFSFITGFFAGIWGSVLSGIRGFVNRALSFFRPIADFVSSVGNTISGWFSSGRSNNNNSQSEVIPQHAQGGIFNKPHIAQIAEDGAEAVIPLTKPSRARDILSGMLGYFDGAKQGISQLTTGLTGANNYAYTTNNYNYYTTNNNVQMPAQSFTIKDSSGNPQNVARAIAGKTEVQIRNLQGILNSC